MSYYIKYSGDATTSIQAEHWILKCYLEQERKRERLIDKYGDRDVKKIELAFSIVWHSKHLFASIVHVYKCMCINNGCYDVPVVHCCYFYCYCYLFYEFSISFFSLSLSFFLSFIRFFYLFLYLSHSQIPFNSFPPPNQASTAHTVESSCLLFVMAWKVVLSLYIYICVRLVFSLCHSCVW